MGTTRFSDIPENFTTYNIAVASAASNGSGGDVLFRVPAAGYIYSVGRTLNASQAAATVASLARAEKVINLGSAAAGTVVLASFPVATASAAASTGRAFTVGASSVATVAAGDVLQYTVASSTENITHPAGNLQIAISYT